MNDHNRLIDVHHHILPQQYLDALTDLGITKSIGVPFPKWSPQKDMETMDRLGVEMAVVSFSTPGADVPGVQNARSLARLCNKWVTDLAKAHPDRYGAFATLPPLGDVEGALREIEFALDVLALDGVSLSTHYGRKYLGDDLFEPIYQALNARKTVVHVHPTDPPGVQFSIPAAVMDAPFDTTRAAFSLICSGVMERYPDIAFILSHGGGTLPYLSYRMGKMASSVWPGFQEKAPKGFDAYLKQFFYDTAIVSPQALPCLIEHSGASRILAGTDYPFAGSKVPGQCLEAIRTCGTIDDRERTDLLKHNAKAIFRRFQGVSRKKRGH